MQAAGASIAVAGIAAAAGSQLALGGSWRADVDNTTPTELVTRGPYRWIRNPIFVASYAVAVGLALLVPNLLAAATLLLFAAASYIQVRLVEEPYLRRVHGEVYRAYSRRTGRFLPRLP